jgi:hypothetical protein
VAKEKRGWKNSNRQVVRTGGDERSFGDHVNWERIFSVYVKEKGGDSLTTEVWRRGDGPYGFQKRPTITYSPWRWKLQCLPKRWIIFNIRGGSSWKAEVVHWTPAAKTYGQ